LRQKPRHHGITVDLALINMITYKQ